MLLDGNDDALTGQGSHISSAAAGLMIGKGRCRCRMRFMVVSRGAAECRAVDADNFEAMMRRGLTPALSLSGLTLLHFIFTMPAYLRISDAFIYGLHLADCRYARWKRLRWRAARSEPFDLCIHVMRDIECRAAAAATPTVEEFLADFTGYFFLHLC